MKTVIYIFLFVFTACNLQLNAQCQLQIDTVSYSYFNGITGQIQIIDSYKITNNSNDEYLTWVSLVLANNKSNVELAHDFFYIRKGDFNLIEMINENLLNEKSISVGYSFIKNIMSGETFSYFIAKTNSNSTHYQDRIVTIKKKDVEQYLKFQIEEKYFFPLSSIFLIEK